MSWRAMVYGLLLASIAVVITFLTGYSPEAALIGGFGMGMFVTAWAFETSTEPRKGEAGGQ